MQVSKEQIQKARDVILSDWLLQHFPDKVVERYNSVLLYEDNHISVKVGASFYTDFRSGEHGDNIDYLTSFLGYTFVDAVLALIGDTNRGDLDSTGVAVSTSYNEVKEITPPQKADHCPNLYAFLLKRGIPSDVISMLIGKQVLYQSAQNNNIVFISPEQDYYELRGTNSYADKRCKRREKCGFFSKGDHGWCRRMDACAQYKPDPFHGCKKATSDRYWHFRVGEADDVVYVDDTIYVCESAIDAISLYVLHKQHGENTDEVVYASIGGVANQRAIDHIKTIGHIILAVDNDEAGDQCRTRNPELETIRPVYKDWNDDLMRGVYYLDPVTPPTLDPDPEPVPEPTPIIIPTTVPDFGQGRHRGFGAILSGKGW